MDALAELYLDNVGAPHDAAAAQLRQNALEEAHPLSARRAPAERLIELPLNVSQRVSCAYAALLNRTLTEINGLLQHAPPAARVEWLGDIFDRIQCHAKGARAVAHWNSNHGGALPPCSASGWLRR